MSKLTVKDLFDKKGKVKLTELYVTNALEAYAAEQAGIDIQIVSFKKETLRTGVPTNKWFRDAHIKDIREAAPNTFMIYGLGQLSTPEKAIDAALVARENGADAVYCGNSPKYIEALRNEGLPAVSHIGLIPYKSTWTGGFKAVGKTAVEALELFKQIKSYEDAGAIAIELEVVPVEVATELSKRTSLLVWSMGAGAGCDAQYLFSNDILGYTEGHIPRHSKVYRNFKAEYDRLQEERITAFKEFVNDVDTGVFPETSHLVHMDDDELDRFFEGLDKV